MVVLTTVSMVVAWGCSTSDDRLGVEIDNPPAFGAEEAGADANVEGGLTSYCPTNKCPPGWMTCANSRFPCDVNLWTDVNNCGACGRACPLGGANETFSCVDGVCVIKCNGFPASLDCDGLADNGCEASAIDDDHCGSCAKKCTDPAKGCAYQKDFGTGDVDCGCPGDKLRCGPLCVDTKNEDTSCGDCTTYCDATGGGAPVYPNSYYGCKDGQCGALKCTALHANCDGKESNGCETSVVSNDNCGGCGLACPAGQSCHLNGGQKPECMCPPDTTYCEMQCSGDVCMGQCVDLTSDTYNCGACGASCSGWIPNAQRACNYGTCTMRCDQGRADCNNSQADGCEVNTDSDPRNCGGCGRVCDAVAGQACVAGRCVVEPCSEDAGGVAR